MASLAVIPARGGSKRLPRKNIKRLNGKPLIQYTLEAVVDSGVFSEIILSSDDDEILDAGSIVSGVTLEKRSSELAEDNTKVIDLVKEIAQRKSIDKEYEKIGLFLPTCPFRTAKHIQEGVRMLGEKDYSVVSVTEMREPIQLALSVNNGEARLDDIFSPSPLVAGNTRSQEFDKFYRVNGGFYVAWFDKFLKGNNFFQGKVKAYIMDYLSSVDIDNQIDFEWAEFLQKNNYVKGL